MKVRNLFVSYISNNDIDKLVIVKKPSKIESRIKNIPDDVYFSVFTKTGYYFNKNELSTLEMYLSPKATKEDITYDQLRIFYENNNEKILKNILKKSSNIIGFKG